MATMTAAVLERQDAAPSRGGSPEVCHLWCCDENVAMCGLDISGERYDLDGEDPDCPLCAIADEEGLPCPVPGCRGDAGG
jgi:hypothetical protein